MELNTVPELDPPGIDPIYTNNALLKSECNGITEFSIHENSLLNVMSYTSIINQETDFSKSLMSLRTDLPKNDVGGNETTRTSFPTHSHVLDSPSAFSVNAVPSSCSKEAVVANKDNESQEWNGKGPKKRKNAEDSETSMIPRKLVRFNDSSASSEDLNQDSSIHANRINAPGKSGSTRSAPKFFTQGSSNRENLKHAAIANVKLGKITNLDKKSKNSRSEKYFEDQEASLKSKELSQASKLRIHDKYTRQNTPFSDTTGEPFKASSSAHVSVKDFSSKPHGKSRLTNPPSPPEVTLFKPKITYGRSARKSKESSSPSGSSSSAKSCSSTEINFGSSNASNSDFEHGESNNLRSRLVATASIENSDSLSNNTIPSIEYRKSCTSHNRDPLAPGPSSESRNIKDVNKNGLNNHKSSSESKFTDDSVADNSDGEHRNKKKKKRNPVVIHDHITVIQGITRSYLSLK